MNGSCRCTECIWSLGGEAQGQVTRCSEEWKDSGVSMEKQQRKEKLGEKTFPIKNEKGSSEVNP